MATAFPPGLYANYQAIQMNDTPSEVVIDCKATWRGKVVSGSISLGLFTAALGVSNIIYAHSSNCKEHCANAIQSGKNLLCISALISTPGLILVTERVICYFRGVEAPAWKKDVVLGEPDSL